MNESLVQYMLLILSGTTIVSLFLTLIVRSIALKVNLVSIPRKDRWSERKVALMGGISVYVAFTLAFWLIGAQEHVMIWLGASIMFITGFWDDKFELKPLFKFLLQFLAATVLVFANYSLVPSWPFWISIPLTYFWIIGITNALNLLDNMDGLAAGTATIIAIVFGFLALKLGVDSVALLSFSLAGAVGGFLILNYNPAKIFMGDSGSLFIGYTMAALPMAFSESLTDFGSYTVLPLVVAITIMPIFDTSLVTFLRIFKGRSPSQGGADHTSHRLVFAGLTERSAVHALYLISIIFGGIVLIFYPDNAQVFYLLLCAGLVGLFYFGLYLSRLNVYGSAPSSRFEELIINMPSYLKSRVHLILIMADIILIIVAFALAYVLLKASPN